MRALRTLRQGVIIGAVLSAAWWWCASPLARLLPGMVVIACIVWLVLEALGWARDPLWHDESGLEREMTRARFAQRERLVPPREE